jgi:hypothetical protein
VHVTWKPTTSAKAKAFTEFEELKEEDTRTKMRKVSNNVLVDFKDTLGEGYGTLYRR